MGIECLFAHPRAFRRELLAALETQAQLPAAGAGGVGQRGARTSTVVTDGSSRSTTRTGGRSCNRSSLRSMASASLACSSVDALKPIAASKATRVSSLVSRTMSPLSMYRENADTVAS